jgi:hypothetical protein
VLLVIGALAGYSVSQNDPNRTVIPTNTVNWDKELAPALAKLSNEDKRLAAAYLARAKLGELFGGAGVPSGLTIAEAIREQRNWEQAQAANDAESKKLETRIKAEKDAVAKQISDPQTVRRISLERRWRGYHSERRKRVPSIFVCHNRTPVKPETTCVSPAIFLVRGHL